MTLQRQVLSFFAPFVAICSVALGQGNSPQPPNLPGSPGAIFVPLAPCRIVNTLTDSTNTALPPQAARHIDITTTRCGRIVPSYAIGYALTTVSYSHTPPEKLASGAGRAEHDIALAVQSNRLIDFTMPAEAEIAVDIYGYFVPAGTPISPTAQAVPDSRKVVATSTVPPMAKGTGRPAAEDVTPGDKGQIVLNASVWPFTETGVLMMTPNSSYPWIVAKTPTADALSGFYLFNGANNPYLLARADGALQLLNGSFLDGRSDYFGVSPLGGVSRDNHSIAVPTNIVHDVTLVNPRDLNGGNGQRVVFFNAKTDDENGSPDITKFQAITTGYAGSQKHINFDSQIYSHAPGNQFYHYRAFSTAETKDTFWVKPATNATSVVNTRADMYLSGHFGINNPSLSNWYLMNAVEGPNTAIGFGLSTDLHVISNAYQDNAGWKYKTTGPAANFYLYNGTHNWRVTGSGTADSSITWTTAMTLGMAGTTPDVPKLTVPGIVQATAGVTFPDGITQKIAYPFNSTSNTSDLNRSVDGPLTSSVTNTSTNASAAANLTALAANGIAYVRLGSTGTPAKDWRIGVVDSTGIFKIRDNTVAGTPGDLMTISGSSIHFNGNVDGTTIQATYQDLAEWVPAAEPMIAGTVVVVGEDSDNTVTASTRAYDTSVAGVVSANPGLLLGVASASKAKISTTGRVRVRVDATKSPIRKGDLLVTSDRPGMAMKSEPLDVGGVKLHRPGTLIGKALEPLASGEGEILVLLSLQ
jgi:hypothetical protein